MILLRKTLRDQRRSLVGWGVGVALLVLVESALWPTISDMPDWDETLAGYPEGMRELFDVEAMTTGRGFLNAELFTLLLPALFITFAIARGARLVAGEEEAGTLEVLLVTPLSTGRLLWEKALALALALAGLGVAVALATWVCSLAFGLDISVTQTLAGALALVLLGFEYGALALAVGAATGRRALAIGVATAAAVAAYVLYAAAVFVDWLADWRGWSPFDQALSGGPLGDSVPWELALTGVAGLVVVLLASPVLARRDIAAP